MNEDECELLSRKVILNDDKLIAAKLRWDKLVKEIRSNSYDGN